MYVYCILYDNMMISFTLGWTNMEVNDGGDVTCTARHGLLVITDEVKTRVYFCVQTIVSVFWNQAAD